MCALPRHGRPRVQLAAGGLVWRVRDGVRQLAVVHRPRGDWVLPKGGVESGESLEDAARREVKEETGVDVELAEFAGTIHFEHDARLEVVAFWHMCAIAEGAFAPGDEIDRLEWATPAAAARRLSYERERSLVLATFHAAADRAPSRARRWWRAAMDPSADRLRTVLSVVELELDARSDAMTAPIHAALAGARAASDRGDAEAGWHFVKLAERLQLLGAGEHELNARAAALRHEGTDKLTSWRAATVAELIAQAGISHDAVNDSAASAPDRPPIDTEAAARRRVYLYDATRIRDEAADNTYRRLALVRRNRTVLLPVIVGAVLALLILAATGVADLGAEPAARDAGFLAATMLAGVLGASISAIQSLGQATGQRVPEALASATMTLTRPAVGAGAALAALIIAEAGFLQLDTETGYVLLALGFAAGFSERFIVRLVETTTKK